MADYSENKPIWPGSSSFTSGDTPFGFFDNDTMFQTQADAFASFAAQNVGYPIMDVELIDKIFILHLNLQLLNIQIKLIKLI